MASYQSSDSKKEEFRKYLEKSGVVDAITKVLVTLYEEPEKPTNPLEFMKQYLGGPSNNDYEELKRQNEELQAKVEELQKKLAALSQNTDDAEHNQEEANE
eukprot:GEZU01002435.1.p1 GENE.GEZU01002435.1~~GEZU01002435.1.p1  ORF type:complete len:101 (-),score=45.17 GEZU01002435.1:193-495(-)